MWNKDKQSKTRTAFIFLLFVFSRDASLAEASRERNALLKAPWKRQVMPSWRTISLNKSLFLALYFWIYFDAIRRRRDDLWLTSARQIACASLFCFIPTLPLARFHTFTQHWAICTVHVLSWPFRSASPEDRGMPGSDRLHGTKRKAEPLYNQKQQQAAGGEGQPLHAGSGRHPTKTASSSTSKHKRNKSKHEAETGSACAAAAPPPVGAIKPLVEYDDISSDSDNFLDSPATGNPAESRDVERLDCSDYGESGEGFAKENRTHKHKRSRKKSKDPHRVRESAETAEAGGGKKISKDRDRASKENRKKAKEKTSSATCLASTSRCPGESGSKRPGDSLSSGAAQSAVSLGSSASSASSSISKESGRSSKSRKDKRKRGVWAGPEPSEDRQEPQVEP